MIQSRKLIPICWFAAAVCASAQVPPVPPVPPIPPVPAVAPVPPVAPTPPEPPSVFARPFDSFGVGAGFGAGYSFAQPKVTTYAGRGNEEGLYQRAQTALENHRWEDALSGFNEVVTRGGSRVEGALY